jgi:hypothetical protein
MSHSPDDITKANLEKLKAAGATMARGPSTEAAQALVDHCRRTGRERTSVRAFAEPCTKRHFLLFNMVFGASAYLPLRCSGFGVVRVRVLSAK